MHPIPLTHSVNEITDIGQMASHMLEYYQRCPPQRVVLALK